MAPPAQAAIAGYVVDPLDPEHPDFEDLIAQYKQAFAVFDDDSSGTITASEVGIVMRALGQNPTEAELESIIKEIDSSNDGVLDFDEFCICMAKAKEGKDAPPAGASQAPALAVIVKENGLLGDIKNFFVKDRGIKNFFASLRGPSAEEIAAAKAAAEAAAVAKAEASAAAEAADAVWQAEMKALADEVATRILDDAMAMAAKDRKEAQEAAAAAAAASTLVTTLASNPRPPGQVGGGRGCARQSQGCEHVEAPVSLLLAAGGGGGKGGRSGGRGVSLLLAAGGKDAPGPGRCGARRRGARRHCAHRCGARRRGARCRGARSDGARSDDTAWSPFFGLILRSAYRREIAPDDLRQSPGGQDGRALQGGQARCDLDRRDRAGQPPGTLREQGGPTPLHQRGGMQPRVHEIRRDLRRRDRPSAARRPAESAYITVETPFR